MNDGAGELAMLANVGRDSLYVLLTRWRKWGLVRRDSFATPYRYAIASQGQHYLNNLDKWYGPKDIVYQAVLDNCKVSFYWNSLDYAKKHITKTNLIVYPFQSENDYLLIRPDANGRLTYRGNSRLLIKKDNALKALYAVRDDLKLRWGNGLIDKLVSEKLITRN